MSKPATGAEIEVAVTSLSLLIIDLGDCCVVRVEKGTYWRFDTKDETYEVNEGDPPTRLIPVTFADLRAALDEAPVPRIDFDGHRHTLIYDNPALTARESSIGLANGGYDALSQLAGHPLPIWEGNGKWEELNPPPSVGISWELPFTAWRYSR